MSQQHSRPAGATGSPVLLPTEIAASEDLTWHAQRSGGEGESPYAGDPRFEDLFDRLARALHRREFPHALLVGERGVGKSALIAEFARRAVRHTGFLTSKRILMVDCRHTPADEARAVLTAVLGHTAPHRDLVVCLEGLHGLVLSAQRESGRAVLLAALARARCHYVALLTPNEHEELAADDPEFADCFTAVIAPEPDPATACRIMNVFARGLAERYRVVIEPEAVRQSVMLSASYVLNDQLPAKALRVLTAACEDADYSCRQLGLARERVTEEDVLRVVSERTAIPVDTLRGVADRTDYVAALAEVVFGQERAVREVATELGLIKAGMTDPGRPASVMLFLGQTGTGKTEMAKALARFYSTSRRLRTYTLGNCVEAHSVATIIGVPPGYVGSERGGRLVTELNADPYGVFLLDEADKAHPDVLQPFLNLFDEGWVTDQRGTRAHAQKSIFILTTNVGQRMIADLHREGKSPEEITARMKEALSQIRHGKSDRPVFTPEFLARIRRVIVFRPLDGAAMAGITGKQIRLLQAIWRDKRNRRLIVPGPLTEYLGRAARRLDEKANGKEGGRIVRKLVADWIEAPLQEAMSAAPEHYATARTVRIGYDDAGEIPLPDQPFSAPEITVHFDPREEPDEAGA